MLPITKDPKIPKNKPHLYAELLFIEKKKLGWLRNRFLKKYCPKYTTHLELKSKTPSTMISALKRIKKVTEVEDYFGETRASKPFENQWRLILQNKLKSVESYNDHINLRNSIKKHKVFSGLTTLLLRNIMSEDAQEEEEEEELKRQKLCVYLWRLQLRYLGGFVHLKFLDVKIHFRENLIVFKKLNSLPRLLSSLDTLKITSEIDSDVDGKAGFLPKIIECPNLLRYITHLTIGTLKEKEDNEIFKQLPTQCKNLKFLSVDNISAESLKILKDFEKLEEIVTEVKDPIFFIENFVETCRSQGLKKKSKIFVYYFFMKRKNSTAKFIEYLFVYFKNIFSEF